MDIQNTLDSIPADLLHEIISRLPIKTVVRCRCVSKILASRLGCEDFKQLFLTRSLTRPRLLFAVGRLGILNKEDLVFYSSPQPQNPYEKSSLVVKADFHTKFPRLIRLGFIYASGLLYFSDMCISTTKGEEDNRSRVLYNPITGQYVILPKPRAYYHGISVLGFDPIDKQFKLLLINALVNNERIHFILTLGTGKMRWRTVKCPLLRDYASSCSNVICINGVLYYLAKGTGERSLVIVCFDVRTETFKFKPIAIDVKVIFSLQLINDKGKLALTILGNVDPVELSMLVLEDDDVEKPEWLKYTLPSAIKFDSGMYVVGMTSTDEIVLSTTSSRLINVYYFNPKRNSLQSVEVQGIENHDYVHVIMDHVEDLYVNDAKYFKSNIHAHLRQGINTFEAQCLSDEEDDDQVS